MITLVIGKPGTAKSQYVQEHLADGIAYDLDAIAAALRLRSPHEEAHKLSRVVANALLPAFLEQARLFSGEAFVIRTAPTLNELQDIMPARIVVCTKQCERPSYPFDLHAYATRMCEIMTYAEEQRIELLFLPAGSDAPRRRPRP